ncbi:MAG: hypothetical protein Q9162_000781 [Coniocarpon cinnabarinum]
MLLSPVERLHFYSEVLNEDALIADEASFPNEDANLFERHGLMNDLWRRHSDQIYLAGGTSASNIDVGVFSLGESTDQRVSRVSGDGAARRRLTTEALYWRGDLQTKFRVEKGSNRGVKAPFFQGSLFRKRFSNYRSSISADLLSVGLKDSSLFDLGLRNASQPEDTISVPINSRHGTVQLKGSIDVISAMEQPVSASSCQSSFMTDWTPDNFLLGEVIMAPWYAPNFDPKLTLSDRDTAYAPATGTISAKMRLMIVISKLPDGLLTIPVTSFGGKGNASLTRSKRDCFFRLRDSDDSDVFWTTSSTTQTLTTVADQEQNLPWGGWRPRPESHVDVSRTWTVECKTPVKHMWSRLMTDDLRKLVHAAFQVMEWGVQELMAPSGEVSDAEKDAFGRDGPTEDASSCWSSETSR